MDSTVKKYGEILGTLDEWKINRPDLAEVITGKRSLNKNGVMAWSHLAVAFNREVHPLISEKVKTTSGLSVVITESDPEKRLELLRRSLLYTDLTVVFSGGEAPHDYKPILDAVRKGGIICDQIPEFFDDLLALRPILDSGLGICLQRHFLDASPGESRAAWIMSNLKRDGGGQSRQSPSPTPLNPYSAYSDFFRPASLDCIFLGADYDQWKGRMTTSLKSPQELAFASILSLELPYLSNIPIEALVELRSDQPDLFRRARHAIRDAVAECMKFDGAATEIEEFARHLQRNYLDSAARDSDDDVKLATSKKYVRRCSPVIFGLSLGFNLIIGNWLGVLFDSMNLGQQGFGEVLESRTENREGDGNDLYLFSKLESLSASKETTKA